MTNILVWSRKQNVDKKQMISTELYYLIYKTSKWLGFIQLNLKMRLTSMDIDGHGRSNHRHVRDFPKSRAQIRCHIEISSVWSVDLLQNSHQWKKFNLLNTKNPVQSFVLYLSWIVSMQVSTPHSGQNSRTLAEHRPDGSNFVQFVMLIQKRHHFIHTGFRPAWRALPNSTIPPSSGKIFVSFMWSIVQSRSSKYILFRSTTIY